MRMETSVEVGLDPMTAFAVFTEEMDQWWGNGPIDSWDFSRTVARRVEPGVGGRVLELYDDDVLELARVTVWEPGRRLTWASSVDDVSIDVTFQAVGERTVITVEGRVADGGRDAAGLAVLRVTPEWIPRYLARGRRPWPRLGRTVVFVSYARPAAAARWLCDAFGFEATRDIAIGEAVAATWIELRLGTSAIVVQGSGSETAELTHEVMVFVDDLPSHFEKAERAGAKIVQPVDRHGFTGYVADDPEGRRWRFAQASRRQEAAEVRAGS